MEFASFVSFFFVAAFCLMPIVGFSYKVCEGVYKRSLFAKAAKQIQLFSACLLMLAGIAFCTDYFLQGILFRADLALAAGSMWGIGLRPLLLLAGGLCAAAVLCFAAVKFSKSLFWYVISAAGGIAVAVFAAQWINLAAISAASTISSPASVTSIALVMASMIFFLSNSTIRPSLLITFFIIAQVVLMTSPYAMPAPDRIHNKTVC